MFRVKSDFTTFLVEFVCILTILMVFVYISQSFVYISQRFYLLWGFVYFRVFSKINFISFVYILLTSPKQQIPHGSGQFLAYIRILFANLLILRNHEGQLQKSSILTSSARVLNPLWLVLMASVCTLWCIHKEEKQKSQ